MRTQPVSTRASGQHSDVSLFFSLPSSPSTINKLNKQKPQTLLKHPEPCGQSRGVGGMGHSAGAGEGHRELAARGWANLSRSRLGCSGRSGHGAENRTNVPSGRRGGIPGCQVAVSPAAAPVPAARHQPQRRRRGGALQRNPICKDGRWRDSACGPESARSQQEQKVIP